MKRTESALGGENNRIENKSKSRRKVVKKFKNNRERSRIKREEKKDV